MTVAPRAWLLSFVWGSLVFRAAAMTPASAAEADGQTADAAGADPGKPQAPAKPAFDVVRELLPSCVRVLLWAKRHEGASPEVADLGMALTNDRPARLGGFWWSGDEVLIVDPVLSDHFIHRIEVETADGLRRFPAEVSARFVDARLALLKVQGLDSGASPAKPLVFAPPPPPPPDKHVGALRVAFYAWNAGDWTLTLSGGPTRLQLTENGEALAVGAGEGLLVDLDGRPVGYSASTRGEASALARSGGPAAAASNPWRGGDLLTAERIGRDELAAAFDALDARLAPSLPEVRFIFRQNVEDGDEVGFPVGDDDGLAGAVPELRVAGWQVEARRLLVPCPLGRDLIEKIEDISVIPAGGPERPGRFAGALREFEAVYVEVDEDLPGGPIFLVGAPERGGSDTARAAERRFREGELFLRWRVDFATGRRRAQPAYDRPRGLMTSFRDFPGIWTHTNESVGALAYGLDGALLAAAIAPRVPAAGDDSGYPVEKFAGFRPIAWLAGRLGRRDAIDAAVKPAAEGEARRRVSFGVEAQGLTRDTAVWFGVEGQTRGGRIGMLVTHVYPGMAADKAGIREKDILLRVRAPERREPFELTMDAPFPWFNQLTIDFDAMPPERAAMFFGQLPPPWPDRDNALAALLTAVGAGRRVAIEYVRDGETRQAEFVTEKGPPDFASAPKWRSRALGLTVKPLTYEVARYYHRPENDGAVIVHAATPGGKAQVAGMRKYHLVTRVNGQPVAGLDDFRAKTALLEDGSARAVEFTLEDMGRTRLVKIELAPE